LLGESGTTFFADAKLAKRLRPGFPRSLDGAPCLLPSAHATVRRTLDQWFESNRLRPRLVAEFDDSTLMYAFGEEGQGFFPAPTVFEDEFRRRLRAAYPEKDGRVVLPFRRIFVVARVATGSTDVVA